MSEEKSPQSDKSIGAIVADSFKEVGQTFVHLVRAPRALWGINVSYFFEGLVYFGILTVLGKYLSEDVGMSDMHAGWVYSIFTGGITFMMLVLGGVSDKIGVRRALMISLVLMCGGRLMLGVSGVFAHGEGVLSPMFFSVGIGLFLVVLGYGMYQPAAYAGVKEFTNEKTAAIGYAMLYALMNFGAFFSGILSPPIRQASGIKGVFWVYLILTGVALLSIVFILTKRTATLARERLARESAEDGAAKGETAKPEESAEAKETAPAEKPKSLLEPMTIGLGLVSFGVVVALIALTISAKPPQTQQWIDKHSGQLGALLGAVTEGQEAEFKEKSQELEASALELDRHVAGFAAKETVTDKAALEVWRHMVRNDTPLLLAVAKSGQAPQVTDDNAERLRDMIREYALVNMAAAYRFSGKVDSEVVGDLQKRLKEPSEELVPLPNIQSDELVGWLSQPTAGTLQSLATYLLSRASQLEGAPYSDPVIAQQWRSQATFLQQVAAGYPDKAALTDKVLVEQFLAASTTSLEQARLLKSVARELNFMDRMTLFLTELFSGITGAKEEESTAVTSFASLLMDGRMHLYGEVGGYLHKAEPKSLGSRFTGWLVSSGWLWLVLLVSLVLLVKRLLGLRPDHPFHNARFTFFIFILIPVQTLFAHNWLTLPYYINRAFAGTNVGENFEFFSNLNPILIFVLTPIIAAMTTRANVYKMMIAGTFVMAAPTFLLVLPAQPALLLLYIVLMTIGEAMWQPRFLQLVAEIAPEGKTGAYMGIAQMPWFLTKVVTGLYSGYLLAQYCPRVGPQDSEFLWLIYAIIAMSSPIALVLARNWMGTYFEKKQAS